LNNYFLKGKYGHKQVGCLRHLGCSKTFVQQGRSQFCARSVLPVREHGKLVTCLREAAPAGMEPLACQP